MKMNEEEKKSVISKEDKKIISDDLSMIPYLLKSMEKNDSKEEKSKFYFEILERIVNIENIINKY